MSNSSAFCGKWLGLYGGKLRRSKILDVEVLKGVELVVAVVVAARGDPETNEGHLLKYIFRVGPFLKFLQFCKNGLFSRANAKLMKFNAEPEFSNL